MSKRTIRALFSVGDWLDLQTCVVLVCRAAPTCRDSEQGWENLDRAVADVAGRAALAKPVNDLALIVLAELAEYGLRSRVIARARAVVTDGVELASQEFTERAAAIVDRAYREEGFRFRATLISLSLLVEDEMIKAEVVARH